MSSVKDKAAFYREGPQEDFIDYESIRREEEYYAWIKSKQQELYQLTSDIQCLMRLTEELDKKKILLLKEIEGHF